MITQDVCLEPMFTDMPTEARIARIAACGYNSIEFWLHDAEFNGSGFDFGKPRDPAAVRQACEEAGVTLNNIVVNPPDDGTIGGAPILEEKRHQYLERVEAAIKFAQAAGCNRAITCAGDRQPGMKESDMRSAVENALGDAARIAEKHEFVLLLEPLNSYLDHKGYWLDSSDKGAEIVRSIDSPGLRLLYDVYHMQIMEGNVIDHIRRHADIIGHFHSAGVPGRGELDIGELDYPAILQAISTAGYRGNFGLEYFPAVADHAESLRRVRAYLQGAVSDASTPARVS